MSDFATFCTDVCQDNKKIIFAFNQNDLLANSDLNLLEKLLASILSNVSWRLIIFSDELPVPGKIYLQKSILFHPARWN